MNMIVQTFHFPTFGVENLLYYMCNFKVAEEVMPPAAVLQVANILANVIPEVKFFPTKDLAELAFRNLKYRKLVCPSSSCKIFRF